MKLTNTSEKLIGIGEKYILPEETVELTEEEAGLPALRVYAKLGLVKLEDETVAAVHDDAEFDRKVREAAEKMFAEMKAKEKKAEEKEEQPEEEVPQPAEPVAELPKSVAKKNKRAVAKDASADKEEE